MPGTDGVEITGPSGDRYDEILTPEAISLIDVLPPPVLVMRWSVPSLFER